jgi:hypothetical protein
MPLPSRSSRLNPSTLPVCNVVSHSPSHHPTPYSHSPPHPRRWFVPRISLPSLPQCIATRAVPISRSSLPSPLTPPRLPLPSFRGWPAASQHAAAYTRFSEPILYLRANSSRTPAPFPVPPRRPRGKAPDSLSERELNTTLWRVIRELIRTGRARGYTYAGASYSEPNPIMDPSNCLDRFGAQPPLTCL